MGWFGSRADGVPYFAQVPIDPENWSVFSRFPLPGDPGLGSAFGGLWNSGDRASAMESLSAVAPPRGNPTSTANPLQSIDASTIPPLTYSQGVGSLPPSLAFGGAVPLLDNLSGIPGSSLQVPFPQTNDVAPADVGADTHSLPKLSSGDDRRIPGTEFSFGSFPTVLNGPLTSPVPWSEDTDTRTDQSSILDYLDQIYKNYAPVAIQNYLRGSWEHLAQVQYDIPGYLHDAATDLPQFLRDAGPTLTGLGLSIPRFDVAGWSIYNTASDLSQRAHQVLNVLDSTAARLRTVAALRTDAKTIIGGGGRDLSPAQVDSLQPGEVAAKLPNAHAEITVLREAQKAGMVPRVLATTRPICQTCATYIRQQGGRLTSPTTAIFP